MQFELASDMKAEHPLKDEVLKLFVECNSGTVEGILRTWLQQPGSKIEILPTLNDHTDIHEGVGFGFSRNDGEPYFVSVPLEVMRSQYPKIRPASDFISTHSASEDPAMGIDIDSSKVDQMLGINRQDLFDDVLCGEMLKFHDAINYAIMYGLCPSVSVTISELDPEALEDCETDDWEYEDKRVLWVNVMYQDQTTAACGYIPGFGEWVYTTIE